LAQKASGSAYLSASSLSDQLTTATITNPSLNNMVAATMTIPAGWKLEGIEMMPPCTAASSPVYRAYSPDGLMQFRQEPILEWHWDSRFRLNQNGCAQISGVMSAADFLKYYVETTMPGGVHIVGHSRISRVMERISPLRRYTPLVKKAVFR